VKKNDDDNNNAFFRHLSISSSSKRFFFFSWWNWRIVYHSLSLKNPFIQKKMRAKIWNLKSYQQKFIIVTLKELVKQFKSGLTNTSRSFFGFLIQNKQKKSKNRGFLSTYVRFRSTLISLSTTLKWRDKLI